jgi:hypothetical protein
MEITYKIIEAKVFIALIRTYSLFKSERFLVVGDWNAKHSAWDPD